MIFRVPDRTGDSVPDLVEYHWPGPPSGDLVRRINGGAWGVVMARVAELELIYDTVVESVQTTQVQRQIVEPTPLVLFNGWTGVPSANVWAPINATDWAAQTVAVAYAVPPGMNPDSLTIDSVRLRMRGTGLVTVSIHLPSVASPTLPDSAAIGSVTLPLLIADPNGNVVTFPFSGVRLSGAPSPIIVLVRGDAASTASLRFFRATTAPEVGHVLRRTSNAGGSWTGASPNEDAWFAVDGTYAVIGPVTTTTSATRLHGLTVRLRSMDGTAPIRAGIATLNRPVMP
ncbi:hypothetical protein J4558_23100 [Leptolyngbya sp. 15MV]|nr:hypothetical protein J4558_23100 [Leptolyngbya sp. 15MV]